MKWRRSIVMMKITINIDDYSDGADFVVLIMAMMVVLMERRRRIVML